jgi:hypothetical protein
MRGMDFERAKKRLEGCYITVPTMFRDPNLELDTWRPRGAMCASCSTRHYREIRHAAGRRRGAATFSAMTFDERLQVAERS